MRSYNAIHCGQLRTPIPLQCQRDSDKQVCWKNVAEGNFLDQNLVAHWAKLGPWFTMHSSRFLGECEYALVKVAAREHVFSVHVMCAGCNKYCVSVLSVDARSVLLVLTAWAYTSTLGATIASHTCDGRVSA